MGAEFDHFDRAGIEGLIPHRVPFMFLRSARILIPGVHAAGELADLSHPDFKYLRGHFPGFQIIPGAILMEAHAELAGVALASSGSDEFKGKIGVLAASSMKYRIEVKPVNSVSMDAKIIRRRLDFCVARVEGRVDNNKVIEGEITFKMVPDPRSSTEGDSNPNEVKS